MAMIEATEKGDRLEQLKALRLCLAIAIDNAEDAKSIAQLARQYRETIKEIEEIEGGENQADEIGAILKERENNGEPGAVRKNRAKIPKK